MKHPNKSTIQEHDIDSQDTIHPRYRKKHPQDNARVWESWLESYVISGQFQLSLG